MTTSFHSELAKSSSGARSGIAKRSGLALAAVLLAGTALASPARAADEQSAAAEESAPSDENEIVVTGSLGEFPLKDVGTVFGFDKTLVETPRSASSVSSEQMERFGITDIYDLVAQAPGTFTNSFFGVGGALDIRGTPGEVYFRGVRRLDNAGNYPTPIGASERIDIVRGPASPIFGHSKTGGYMNFVPKTARVQGGALLDAPEGEIRFTTGSWSKADVSVELRGPVKLGETEIGYSLYAEIPMRSRTRSSLRRRSTPTSGNSSSSFHPRSGIRTSSMPTISRTSSSTASN